MKYFSMISLKSIFGCMYHMLSMYMYNLSLAEPRDTKRENKVSFSEYVYVL